MIDQTICIAGGEFCNKLQFGSYNYYYSNYTV